MSLFVSSRAEPVTLQRAPERPVLVWYWGRQGGGAAYCAHLLDRLADRFGTDQVVACLSEQFEFLERVRARGVPVETVPGIDWRALSGRQAIGAAASALAFRRLLYRLRPGRVLVPMNFALAWPLAALLPSVGARLVYAMHDAEPHPGDIGARLQRFTQARLLAAAADVLALSATVRDDGLRKGLVRPERAAVSPLGAVFPPLTDRPRPAPSGCVRLLVAGRLAEYKGLGLLAAALEALSERRDWSQRDWSLTIAGRLLDRRVLDHSILEGPQVTMRTEWMDDAAFGELFDTHDVLLCPYTEASQSGVVVEALRRAMPVVVTPVGALPEQVGYGRFGLVAEAATGEAVARALGALLDREVAYEELSRRALEGAFAAYDEAHFAPLLDLLA